MDRWATFDCYGTLIDWNGGVHACLARLWPTADPDALLRRYHRLEPSLEADGSNTYRKVLTEILVGIAVSEGLVVPPGEASALAESLPSWPPGPPWSSAGCRPSRCGPGRPRARRPGAR